MNRKLIIKAMNVVNEIDVGHNVDANLRWLKAFFEEELASNKRRGIARHIFLKNAKIKRSTKS